MRIVYDVGAGPVLRARLEADERGDVLLDADGVAALTALTSRVERCRRWRVLVLEGTPGVFCGGMDLGVATTDPSDGIRDLTVAFARCLDRMRRLDQAVLCVVDGEAAGGGVGLAGAADVTVATASSSFALPELTLGLTPAVVLPILRERMAPQKARWWALSGARLTAAEAARAGLVDELVPHAEEAERTVSRIVRGILRRSPEAVASWKRLFDETAALDRAGALALGAERTRRALCSESVRNAIRGWLDGAAPPWFDRDRRHAEGAG